MMSQTSYCTTLHLFTAAVRSADATAVFLFDHELLEGVEIGRDERADGLVVIVEDLLSSAL